MACHPEENLVIQRAGKRLIVVNDNLFVFPLVTQGNVSKASRR